MTYDKAITDAYNAVNGEGSALTAYAQLKRFQAEIDDAIEAVKESAIEERRKYGKEVINRCGFELEVVTVGACGRTSTARHGRSAKPIRSASRS